MDFLRIQREVTEVAPDVITTVWGVPITNTFLMSVMIALLFVLLSWMAVKRFTLRPSRFQNVVEVLYEQMLDLVEQITANKQLARRIFPLIAALFLYIGVANLIGLIPGVTSFTYNGEALFRTPTSDFNTTFGLALAMMLFIQFESVRSWGFFKYLGRFFKFKEVFQAFRKGMKEGVLAIIDFFIGLLDIFAEIAKVISLSFRLFGNMFAGEVLALLVLGAFAVVLPSLWLSLNLMFALVQAVVFGALVAAYYTLALDAEAIEKLDIDEAVEEHL